MEQKETNNNPELVVFDLRELYFNSDYTLWPFWVDTHVMPPFHVKGSKVVDTRGHVIKHYPEVPQVLKYLKEQGIPVAVASRTSEIDGANQLVRLFGWDKYIDYKEIYPGCKLNHFEVFKRQTGHPYPSMIFFDDEERNIRDLSKVGVHCVLVRKGVDIKLLKDSLMEFSKKSRR